MRSMMWASEANSRRSIYHAPVAATHKAPVAEQDLQPVVRGKGAVFHDIADRYRHPAVVGHDPVGRERGSERHHCRRKQVEPRRDTRAAEQQNSEKARLEEKGGEGLVGEKRALDRSGHASEHAPVRAKLESHDDTGDDTEPERYTKDL